MAKGVAWGGLTIVIALRLSKLLHMFRYNITSKHKHINPDAKSLSKPMQIQDSLLQSSTNSSSHISTSFLFESSRFDTNKDRIRNSSTKDSNR